MKLIYKLSRQERVGRFKRRKFYQTNFGYGKLLTDMKMSEYTYR